MAAFPVSDFLPNQRRLLVELKARLTNPECQRHLVLVIVCVALLLDNMLYMVIVPIIPIYLDEMTSQEPEDDQDRKFHTTQLPAFDWANVSNVSGSSGSGPRSEHYWRLPLLVKYRGEQKDDARVGVLFASKAIVQLVTSPFSGTVIDRVGYETPMVFGLSVIFVSTIIFAFGWSYPVLFAARSLQGVGSAFADTAGLAMIADQYREEEGARSKAQGVALAFISFGCLVAPPFGGFFYTYCGKAVPFLLLSFMALLDGLLLRFVTGSGHHRRDRQRNHSGRSSERVITPIYRLIVDPYVALCAGALVTANISLAFLEPTIARWMKETMRADEFQIGVVWLPAFLPHVLGVYIAVQLSKHFPTHRWALTSAGLVLEGLSCLLLPFCSSGFGLVILPLMVICFGIALVDTAVLPTLAYLVDARHASVYGSVYAIADISYSLAYAFGPILADRIYQSIGFLWLNVAICFSSLLYAPLLLLLRGAFDYRQFDNEEDEVEEEEEGGGEDVQTIEEFSPSSNGIVTRQDSNSYRMRRLTGSDEFPVECPVAPSDDEDQSYVVVERMRFCDFDEGAQP